MGLVVRPKIVADIIGTDLVFPLNYGQGGDLKLTGSADDNIRQAIFICIFTMLSERYRHREFGTTVPKSVFQQGGQTLANILKREIEESLDKHEFRITNVRVNAYPEPTEGTRIDIEVWWTDLKYRHEQNAIYPFYLESGEELS
jgi:phage baseplate assembly protein W